jgi:hypothetical protein
MDEGIETRTIPLLAALRGRLQQVLRLRLADFWVQPKRSSPFVSLVSVRHSEPRVDPGCDPPQPTPALKPADLVGTDRNPIHEEEFRCHDKSDSGTL